MRYRDLVSFTTKDALALRMPPNVNGEPPAYEGEPFLAKIEPRRVDKQGLQLVIRDRRQFFLGGLVSEDDRASYRRLMTMIFEESDRRKVYVWARYLGDYTLSIRLDPPEQTLFVW